MTKRVQTFQWVIVALVIYQLTIGTDGIQLRQVSVPSVIQAGEGASLLCDVDMQNERLYSVKWYKDEETEFFRYVPRESPPLIVYNLPGINVNKSLSDWQRVYLSRVSLASTGHYRCEVSAEGPSFSSVSGSGHMEVVVLPKKTPEITGGKRTDRTGDLVDVNCTSAASKPAAEIKWFINGIEANANYVRQYKAVSGEDGLETTVLGLTFQVHETHLQNKGTLLTLRCDATFGPSSTRNSHHNNQHQHHSNNNNPPPAASTASLGGYEGSLEKVNPSEHFYNPNSNVEYMSMTSEVRFEVSRGSFSIRLGDSQSSWLMGLICALAAALVNRILHHPESF